VNLRYSSAADSSHLTGRKRKIVRGLLCRPCNVGLGFVRDDTKRMRRAIDM
jgi:hypothetical protein